MPRRFSKEVPNLELRIGLIISRLRAMGERIALPKHSVQNLAELLCETLSAVRLFVAVI
jgi:hypothetical protein